MLPISFATMQCFCRICLQELPPSTSKQQNELLRDLQSDEGLISSLQITTGIAVNITDDYPKQLCLSCYKKIQTFEEFRETALCCAIALHELLLEENFSKNTQHNLQYFCTTCLNRMQTLDNISVHMDNGDVQRWIRECFELKKRTGVDHWPNSVCEYCRDKLDCFLEFQRIARSSFKQLGKMLCEQQINHPDNVLIDEQDKANKPKGKSDVIRDSDMLTKSSEDTCINEASDDPVGDANNSDILESKESSEGFPDEAAISQNSNAKAEQITSKAQDVCKKAIKDSSYTTNDFGPKYYKSIKIPPDVKFKNNSIKKSTNCHSKEKNISLDTTKEQLDKNEKDSTLNQAKSTENGSAMKCTKSIDETSHIKPLGETVASVDSTIISDAVLESKNVIKSAVATKILLKSKKPNTKPHKMLQHPIQDTTIKTPSNIYSIERNDLVADSSHQSNIITGFECNNCMKVFKRKAHLNRHKHYSTICGRI